MSGLSLEKALLDLDEIVHTLEGSLIDEDKGLTVAELAQWAQRRAEVHMRVAVLERDVLDAIAEEARLHGHAPTIAALAARHPLQAADMREKIARVRSLVKSLTASDSRRNAMLNKARSIVRAYLTSLFPPSQAYGRVGQARSMDLPSSTRTTA